VGRSRITTSAKVSCTAVRSSDARPAKPGMERNDLPHASDELTPPLRGRVRVGGIVLKQFDRKGARARRHRRVRVRVDGTAERPRLSVYRSLHHVYAQLIDDQAGRTLAAASTVDLKTGKNDLAAA